MYIQTKEFPQFVLTATPLSAVSYGSSVSHGDDR